MLVIQTFRTKETILQLEKQLEERPHRLGTLGFLTAAQMFALYCLKRHHHSSHSTQPVIPPASQTALAGAAERKAITIFIINDL